MADERSSKLRSRAFGRRAAGPVSGDSEKFKERGADFVPAPSLQVVAVTNGQLSDRGVTRELLERIVSGELGAKLRSQVASWHPGIGRDDIDEAFQEACLRAERSCRGQTEGEVFTWLRTTTHRELGHMQRRSRSRCEVLMDATAPEFQLAAAADQRPEELLIGKEDHAELERFARVVLERLSERDRKVVALHSHGRRRPDIARHLGMTPRSVKRALERIMAQGRDELVRHAGRGCESGERVVARLAFGLANPRETRQAQLHLASCPKCGGLYERLDLWREKVSALLPVPVAEQAHPGFAERIVHGTADALSTLKQRVSEGASAARDQVTDGAANVKQQAAATYYRAVDPTPLAGVRPGAAAASIAGCLAIGGGATYCVERGIDSTRAFRQTPATEHHEQKRPATAKAAATPVPTPTPTATPTPPPQATPEPTVTAQPQVTPAPTSTQQPQATPEPPPVPEEEYEPVTPVTAAAEPSSAPNTPAPAPADGPGEFAGP